MKKNIVFIGKSIDGFIAGKNGELDWLNAIPNPEKNDMGFFALMDEIDAIVMGRTTFDTVCNFKGEWPYKKHVFVLSNSLKSIPEKLREKVTLLNGNEKEILSNIHTKGYNMLYIDGGRTVQNFLKQDLIDELRISTLPILLGDGISLFDILPKPLEFDHVKTEVFLDQIVQSHYKRKK
ncbi:dihydrofolate reductase family protein [uncultured Kriegella sp.]|uniref:dihydrofolate reductase family protein n=1 Tax=uncultured Kriegella sp. TaxID=1798910 RepID=UPI0030D9618A|tara:strand:- start:300766 stop:301302 length:537 start_codon:yes stop_codon:yes gene_type:complete